MTLTNKQKRTGGQILVECLLRQGVKSVYCVPGESYLAALDAFYDVENEIRLIVCRQEGGAANMAEAEGKLTGRPGVCFVTRGPGATNASTGIHTAFQDSTPMILFVGQVGREVKDREGFQEVDLAAMFAPLAKWAAEISDPRRIPEYVHRAFQTAMAGRPGPVVLALPEDVLTESVAGEIEIGLRASPVPADARGDQIERLMEIVDAARRPLLVVGGGGWTQDAGRQVMAFAEQHDLPVAVSLRCQDYVDNRNPNYVGHFAIATEPSLRNRLTEADTVIALGPRLGEMTTAGYSLLTAPRPGKVLVHIHADPEELGRVYQADLPINASPAVVAERLAAIPGKDPRPWKGWKEECRTDFEESLKPLETKAEVDLGKVVAILRERLPSSTIVCSGAGNYTSWFHKYWVFEHYRTQLAPTSGAMGYGVPASIAAAITQPGRTVLSVAGDGCFQMHGQELATAAQYGVKVLFLVINNGIYGTIRMHQEREYPDRIVGTSLFNPDFAALARCYGLHGLRVDKTEAFSEALEEALSVSGSALIEITTSPEAITPRISLSALREASMQKAG